MPDRTIEPKTSLPSQLKLPVEKSIVTQRSIPLHSIYVRGAGVVRLTIVWNAGSRVQSAPYTALTTLAMLSEGSATRSAARIAEDFDFYGVHYDTSVDRDFITITIAAACQFLPQALDMLADMLGGATFPEHELEIYKAKKREQMAIEAKKPSYIVRQAFAEALFGVEHPYGRFAQPDEIMKLTREELLAFRTQFLGSENMFAVCSGDVQQSELSLITTFLDSLPAGDLPPMQQCPRPEALRVERNIERPDSVQCSLRMGCLMPAKGDPHYIALQLLTTVFGGYFSSRLMQNLREQRGYTYGVYASLVNLKHASYLAIACDVGVDCLEDSILQIHHEMRRLQDELIGEEELTMAKNTIVGELMRLLDGPFGIADIVIENIQSGSPGDYVNIFLRAIASVDAEGLRDLARKYYDPQLLTKVTVCPKA